MAALQYFETICIIVTHMHCIKLDRILPGDASNFILAVLRDHRSSGQLNNLQGGQCDSHHIMSTTVQ